MWLRRSDRLAAEYWDFLRAFLRSPGSVGAIAPSSAVLAEAMIAGSDLGGAETVVELGPGTGAFTEKIVARLGRHTTFLAVELDPHAVRRLRLTFPGVHIYQDSAERVAHYLAVHGKRRADAVVCGIPWAIMPREVQQRIMRNVASVLAPEGVFTTMAYLGGTFTTRGREYKRLLKELFTSVEVSQVVWFNIPPAMVYRCQGPRVGQKKPA